jgi:hypothetical protein
MFVAGGVCHVFLVGVTLVVNHYHIIIQDAQCLGCSIRHVAQEQHLALVGKSQRSNRNSTFLGVQVAVELEAKTRVNGKDNSRIIGFIIVIFLENDFALFPDYLSSHWSTYS